MLNIIHRLKSGMFPALFFLTSASALAQPLIIPPGHWQEGMAVGMTEFSGTLYVRDVSWQWRPRAVRMSAPDAVQAGLATGKSGMVSESRAGQDFYILGGHTTSLTTARPGDRCVTEKSRSRCAIFWHGRTISQQVRVGVWSAER